VKEFYRDTYYYIKNARKKSRKGNGERKRGLESPPRTGEEKEA
jgi:hypothetical protein